MYSTYTSYKNYTVLAQAIALLVVSVILINYEPYKYSTYGYQYQTNDRTVLTRTKMMVQ